MANTCKHLRLFFINALNKITLTKKKNLPNREECATVEDVTRVRFQSARDNLFTELETNMYDFGIFHQILSTPNSTPGLLTV